MLSLQEARKYLKKDISDERLGEILGYLYGLVETIIRQEKEIYEKRIRKTTQSE